MSMLLCIAYVWMHRVTHILETRKKKKNWSPTPDADSETDM